MPLTTNVPRSDAYIEDQSVLFDTCAFTWFAKTDERMAALEQVIKRYRIVVPTPVLYELAFGSSEQVNKNEAKLWSRMHRPTGCIDIIQYHFAQTQKKLPQSGVVVVNPGFNEWWTARTRLLAHISDSKAQPGKAKREHSLDALIHATARNCFAPICTANISDFEKLNRIAAKVHHDGPVPLFTPESIVKSLNEAVQYVLPKS